MQEATLSPGIVMLQKFMKLTVTELFSKEYEGQAVNQKDIFLIFFSWNSVLTDGAYINYYVQLSHLRRT